MKLSLKEPVSRPRDVVIVKFPTMPMRVGLPLMVPHELDANPQSSPSSRSKAIRAESEKKAPPR